MYIWLILLGGLGEYMKGKNAEINSNNIEEEEEKVRCDYQAYQIIFSTLLESKKNIYCPKFVKIWKKIKPLNVLYFDTVPLVNYINL